MGWFCEAVASWYSRSRAAGTSDHADHGFGMLYRTGRGACAEAKRARVRVTEEVLCEGQGGGTRDGRRIVRGET